MRLLIVALLVLMIGGARVRADEQERLSAGMNDLIGMQRQEAEQQHRNNMLRLKNQGRALEYQRDHPDFSAYGESPYDGPPLGQGPGDCVVIGPYLRCNR